MTHVLRNTQRFSDMSIVLVYRNRFRLKSNNCYSIKLYIKNVFWDYNY